MKQRIRLHHALERYWHIVAFGTGILLVMLLIGIALYVRATAIMENYLREYLRTVAAVSAQQIDGDILDSIRHPDDVDTEDYRNLAKQLDEIRKQTNSIKFIYTMRKTDYPYTVEFIVDGDAAKSLEEIDEDDNGVIDVDEEVPQPGEPYDVKEIPALQGPAFLSATVDQDIVVDQWGALISGYAPVFNSQGKIVGTLGIDMDATMFQRLSHSAFSPFAILLMALVAISVTGATMWFIWQRRQVALRQVETERNSMVALATHQLGAPLATFRWWLELLQESADAKQTDAIIQMQDAVHRMDTIVTSLQEVTDVERGHIEYEAKRTSLRKLIDIVADDAKPKLKLKQQQLTLRLKQTPIINIDPELIGGVLRELLDNAIAYSPKKSKITIQTARDKNRVSISIIDKGGGVPEGEKQMIFGKFTRGSNAQKFKPDGNGLGLYISRHIVKMAGGTIWVESEEGKGSTFTVELPISQVS